METRRVISNLYSHIYLNFNYNTYKVIEDKDRYYFTVCMNDVIW